MIYLIIGLLVLAFLVMNLRIVRDAEALVIERLGRYDRTLTAGIHFLVPIIDAVARKVILKEQLLDFPPQPVITKDNVTMQIDTVIYYKIFDPRLYTYGVVNPTVALENITATTLRNIIGDMELDETLTSRDTINTKMEIVVDEATDPWGIKVNRVEIKNIIPPDDIRRSMEEQMKAEREKRKTILEADAHKQSVITRKEGDKQAIILDAEAKKAAEIAAAEAKAEGILKIAKAQAEELEMLKKAVGKDGLIMLKQLDALTKVAQGNATKIIVPTNLAADSAKILNAGELLSSALEKAGTLPPEPSAAENDPCCAPGQQHYPDDSDETASQEDSRSL